MFLHLGEATDYIEKKEPEKPKNAGTRDWLGIFDCWTQSVMCVVLLRHPNLLAPGSSSSMQKAVFDWNLSNEEAGVLLPGWKMKGSNTISLSFRKTAACPSSSILLSFRLRKLPSEILTLVKYHLNSCEFCSAELDLLAHHSASEKRESRPPEIPINLRILAESILCQNSKVGIVR